METAPSPDRIGPSPPLSLIRVTATAPREFLGGLLNNTPSLKISEDAERKTISADSGR